MTAAVKALGATLAAAAEQAEAEERDGGGAAGGSADGSSGGAAGAGKRRLQELLQPSDHRRMFMSVAGAYMVTYSSSLAKALHNAPLLLALSAPYALQLLSPATVSGEAGNWWVVPAALCVHVWRCSPPLLTCMCAVHTRRRCRQRWRTGPLLVPQGARCSRWWPRSPCLLALGR